MISEMLQSEENSESLDQLETEAAPSCAVTKGFPFDCMRRLI